ncbi:MAG: hypothetical protein ABJM75_12365 [Luteolibacter sp.]
MKILQAAWPVGEERIPDAELREIIKTAQSMELVANLKRDYPDAIILDGEPMPPPPPIPSKPQYESLWHERRRKRLGLPKPE